MTRRLLTAVLCALSLGVLSLGVLSLCGPALADNPGQHPHYLHALSNLRDARWMLEHRSGDARVSQHETEAVQRIDAAINEIKKASIDDGKNIHDHIAVSAPADHPGRLHEAQALLERAHMEVAREEDDPKTRGLQSRALAHIDAALDQTKHAILDVEQKR